MPTFKREIEDLFNLSIIPLREKIYEKATKISVKTYNSTANTLSDEVVIISSCLVLLNTDLQNAFGYLVELYNEEFGPFGDWQDIVDFFAKKDEYNHQLYDENFREALSKLDLFRVLYDDPAQRFRKDLLLDYAKCVIQFSQFYFQELMSKMIQLCVLRLDETQNPSPHRRRRHNTSPPSILFKNIEKPSPPTMHSAEQFLNTFADPPEKPSSSMVFRVSLDNAEDENDDENQALNTPSKLAARAAKFKNTSENKRPSSLFDPLSSPLPPSASQTGRFSRALDRPLGSSRKRRH